MREIAHDVDERFIDVALEKGKAQVVVIDDEEITLASSWRMTLFEISDEIA